MIHPHRDAMFYPREESYVEQLERFSFYFVFVVVVQNVNWRFELLSSLDHRA
jgi:hypothetical protein